MSIDLAAFPRASREDWLKLVEGVLKGAPYDKRMVARTLDGLIFDALPARRPEAQPVAGRTAGAPWRVIQRIEHNDPAAANAQLLQDLDGGADGAALVFASAASARGFGLPNRFEELVAVLDGVMPELVMLRIEAGAYQARDIALAIARLYEKFDPASLDIRFGLDPIGDFAASGAAPIEWDALSARLGQTATTLRSRGFTAPLARADGRIHHAAGATDAQELAAVLATMVAYLRALEAAGLSIEEAAGSIEATLAADVDQFATTAKARAIRLLWSEALRHCGLAGPAPLKLHMETAWRALTRHDPHVNLLRGTIAAFAAGVGGADSVTVLPFTQALGLPDSFARRLARNTQVILIEESNVHRVADPAAGAGAIEERTEKLAEAAWELFREIERTGGMVEALLAGAWQARIASAREARARDVATRRLPITGTSDYPLLAETPVAVLAPAPAPAPVVPAEGAIACEPLEPQRLAEPFERLRDAAIRAGGARVFLANLGTAADFTARAGFATSLFEAGGIAAPTNDGYGDAGALDTGFHASGARIACLCASDALYAEVGATAARVLKAAGATAVYLAGRPENETELRAAGVDGLVFAGCDALQVLEEVHSVLGIRAAGRNRTG
ncbi:methylmalonyl-CoA mutase family protein [Bosea sp. 117]|uniref:methylmalonyl-CoA mutase family protein n=1 Tax=Bosea sp. 117 TaxID=1125973 RepID=UPI000494B7C8|nr:methylmalonyl-CoA mutase family protein [Bosea sp. 117]